MPKIKKIIIVLFGSILITFFVTVPLLQVFLREQWNLKNKKEEFLKEEEHINNLKRAEQELQGYMVDLGSVDRAVPDDPAVASLVYYLGKTAQGHGLFFENVASFSSEESEKFPWLKETRLVFLSTGSYNDFRRFINTIENSARIIDVEKFSVSSLQGDKKEILSFNVTIKTYSY
jgi:Tfp pilus assembly protein PilO